MYYCISKNFSLLRVLSCHPDFESIFNVLNIHLMSRLGLGNVSYWTAPGAGFFDLRSSVITPAMSCAENIKGVTHLHSSCVCVERYQRAACHRSHPHEFRFAHANIMQPQPPLMLSVWQPHTQEWDIKPMILPRPFPASPIKLFKHPRTQGKGEWRTCQMNALPSAVSFQKHVPIDRTILPNSLPRSGDLTFPFSLSSLVLLKTSVYREGEFLQATWNPAWSQKAKRIYWILSNPLENLVFREPQDCVFRIWKLTFSAKEFCFSFLEEVASSPNLCLKKKKTSERLRSPNLY